MGKEIVFYYDVICPYAYLASRLISDVACRTGAKLLWRPVLLGGIYKATKLNKDEMPDNKMINTFSQQKKNVLKMDLYTQFKRHNVPISTTTVPDVRTLNAMCVLASTPDHLTPRLTHRLFADLWTRQKDVSDTRVLQEAVNACSWNVDVERIVTSAGDVLKRNTAEAVERGAFGVPSLWVNGRLYFGGDRLFMVERSLGNAHAQPHRLLTKPVRTESVKLTFFFDFASPWAYIGFKNIRNLIDSVTPVKVELELVPVLIGAIFKTIGTPMVPILTGGNKRAYIFQDMNDWLQFTGLNSFKFSSHFPLNTVTACRLAIARNNLDFIEALYDATWVEDKDISQKEVLEDLMLNCGLDASSVMKEATSDSVKQQLRTNTQRAIDAGVCGLPSYQVDGGQVVFGQDRSNVVADMLLGWNVMESKL